jgi:hypothetical protein
MNKIRLIFLIVVSVVSLICLFLFSTFHKSPPEYKIDKISEFKLTKISGNGKVYYSNKRIEEEDLAANNLQTVDIKRMEFKNEIYIKSDNDTAFEFFCFGTSFTMLPGSHLYYKPQTKEIYFFTGEFYWYKEAGKQKLDISIKKPQNLLTLSDSGRIRIDETKINIWNYKGNLKFNYNGEDFNLQARQLFSVQQDLRYRRDPIPKIMNILPLPENIDPAVKDIPLTDQDVSVIRFNWKMVRGNPIYKFRLYSSNLRENILLERIRRKNFVTLDMLQFEERDFYWEIFPVDPRTQVEGVPSRLGHIRLIGSLLEKKNVQKPPELNVSSLTRNGNLVIIRGTAEVNADLFINDIPIKVDRDGVFVYSLRFKTIGPKKIIIKLVSPLGVKTEDERNVTIFAE